jgi:hypothetical protein
MKLLPLLAIFVAAPGWAGVRIRVESTELATQKTTTQEILLDSDRLRVNMGGARAGTSVLFLTDGGRNRMVILDKDKNEYREIDQQTMNQVSQQMQGAMAGLQAQLQNMPPEQRARIEQMMRGRGLPGPAAAPQPAVYTAKGSGTVNGFACTKYEGMRGAEKIAELCAAKPEELHLSASDFQIFEKMREFGASLMSGLANSPLAGARMMNLMERGYEGFPVEQTSYSGGQANNRTEVKSAERANFSDAEFSLESARKVELFPGGRRGQ